MFVVDTLENGKDDASMRVTLHLLNFLKNSRFDEVCTVCDDEEQTFLAGMK